MYMPLQNRFQHVPFFSALATFVRSAAAYKALKSFSIWQLLSRATLQAYTRAFLDSPGVFIRIYTCHLFLHQNVYVGECQKRIADAASQYKLLQDDKEERADTTSRWRPNFWWREGHCQCSLEISQSTNGVTGHDSWRYVLSTWCISSAGSWCLDELYAYMLQFLWRDLTSSFDIVGPHYSRSGSFETKFIIGVVL